MSALAIALANANIYREKALSCQQKVADVDFVWYPAILFQFNDISVGTSLSCRKHH